MASLKIRGICLNILLKVNKMIGGTDSELMLQSRLTRNNISLMLQYFRFNYRTDTKNVYSTNPKANFVIK